jgi:hypothetical protein
MKKYRIEISQNDWEYTGYAYIKANTITKISERIIIVDTIEIEFDEAIGDIKEIV